MLENVLKLDDFCGSGFFQDISTTHQQKFSQKWMFVNMKNRIHRMLMAYFTSCGFFATTSLTRFPVTLTK